MQNKQNALSLSECMLFINYEFMIMTSKHVVDIDFKKSLQ